jgi:tetratricopeptide (TPR) repeat protein
MNGFIKVIALAAIASAFCFAQTPQPAAQPAAPVQGGRPQPQAKSQDEFNAFQQLISKPTAAEQEVGAVEFSTKFPQSDLRGLAMLSVMRAYQNDNNAEKTIDAAHKVLEIDSNNPEALVTLSSVIAERTRDTDLDREDRFSEANRAAEKALQTVDTDLMVPPGVPADRLQEVRSVMKSMAHASMGTIEMTKKNFAAAEQHLDMATKINTAQPDPVTWLRLAIARDQLKKYPAALEAANQAVKFAPQGSQAASLAAAQRDRLQKLVSGGPAPAATAPPAATSTATPAGAGAPKK